MISLNPEIRTLPETKVIGKSLRMSLSDNLTADLWRSFMPLRHSVKNALPSGLLSIQLYDKDLDFNRFSIVTEFEKWAAVEVSDVEDIPEGMTSMTIPSGTYAVFLYKGIPANFRESFEYIFFKWLPESDYELDQRPHFELLGEKYKNNHPDSEEEIWVPVRKRSGAVLD